MIAHLNFGKRMKPRICLLRLIGLLAGLLQADAQTSFVLSTNFPVAPGLGGRASNQISTPYGVTAFMNADGRVDLVTANCDLSTLTVFTNDGSGNFASNATYAVSHPASVTAADVNGDGYVDLICASLGSYTVAVLTNDGSGGFGSNAIYVAQGASQGAFVVAAADVNGDGYVDLISANGTASTLTVWTNNGIGGFVLDTNISVYINLKFPRAVQGFGDVDTARSGLAD